MFCSYNDWQTLLSPKSRVCVPFSCTWVGSVTTSTRVWQKKCFYDFWDEAIKRIQLLPGFPCLGNAWFKRNQLPWCEEAHTSPYGRPLGRIQVDRKGGSLQRASINNQTYDKWAFRQFLPSAFASCSQGFRQHRAETSLPQCELSKFQSTETMIIINGCFMSLNF